MKLAAPHSAVPHHKDARKNASWLAWSASGYQERVPNMIDAKHWLFDLAALDRQNRWPVNLTILEGPAGDAFVFDEITKTYHRVTVVALFRGDASESPWILIPVGRMRSRRPGDAWN